MREYELFYLVGESKEGALPAIRTEVEAAVTGAGGTFLPPETTDKRRLAYPVKGETRGFYLARRFTLPDMAELSHEEFERALGVENAVEKMNRVLGLSPNILRFLVLRAEDLPELKPIERTEYAKREVRGRPGRPVAPRPPVVKDTPAPNQDNEAAPVSAEKIDQQLEEVLHI